MKCPKTVQSRGCILWLVCGCRSAYKFHIFWKYQAQEWICVINDYLITMMWVFHFLAWHILWNVSCMKESFQHLSNQIGFQKLMSLLGAPCSIWSLKLTLGNIKKEWNHISQCIYSHANCYQLSLFHCCYASNLFNSFFS